MRMKTNRLEAVTRNVPWSFGEYWHRRSARLSYWWTHDFLCHQAYLFPSFFHMRIYWYLSSSLQNLPSRTSLHRRSTYIEWECEKMIMVCKRWWTKHAIVPSFQRLSHTTHKKTSWSERIMISAIRAPLSVHWTHATRHIRARYCSGDNNEKDKVHSTPMYCSAFTLRIDIWVSVCQKAKHRKCWGWAVSLL